MIVSLASNRDIYEARATLMSVCYRICPDGRAKTNDGYGIASTVVGFCRLAGSWKNGIVRRLSEEVPSASNFFLARSV